MLMNLHIMQWFDPFVLIFMGMALVLNIVLIEPPPGITALKESVLSLTTNVELSPLTPLILPTVTHLPTGSTIRSPHPDTDPAGAQTAPAKQAMPESKVIIGDAEALYIVKLFVPVVPI